MQSTSEAILKELGKSGNPAAIATLLNQVFHPHDINVKVSVKETTLKVVLISQGMTDKSILIFLLMQGINPISPLPFTHLKVHFHQSVNYFVKNENCQKIRYNVWVHCQELNQEKEYKVPLPEFPVDSKDEENSQF
ncbi:MAG: hypothetical protein AB4058_18040 [Microcystaceae cyanobacterium]